MTGLHIREDGTYVDCTLGGGGHSARIAEALGPTGTLVGLDQDDTALAAAKTRLAPYPCRKHFVRSNFRHLADVLDDLRIEKVDGALFDIGVSSPQLDEASRGFSYHHDAPLDMRMDRSQSLTAYDVVNAWDTKALARMIRTYGEERFAQKIARAIVQSRAVQPIERTVQLAAIIKEAIPAPARREGPHPAKRTFQAIRIAVNDELGALEQGLAAAIARTARGGRIAVITFHSLEDRIVKQMFKREAETCTCPPDFPVCVCGNERSLKLVTRKPVKASTQELTYNPRARSAKLRVAEKMVE